MFQIKADREESKTREMKDSVSHLLLSLLVPL